jgi:myosin heavy subunit
VSSTFIDLRQNHLSESSGASFWPSFTDIMMVIVMIFMLASTVLILRNYELVEELRATMAAEKEASEEARVATQTNVTLEEQIDQAQQYISELRMQIMQQNEANKLQNQMLAERDARIEELVRVAAEQYELLQQKIVIISQAETDLADERLKSDKLVDELQLKLSELRELNQRIVIIDAQNREQQKQLSDMELQFKNSNQQLILVRGDYDQLKVKYDKLVKPARTTKGKYVVDIRYEKLKSGEKRIQLKLPGWDGFKTVSYKELHQQLGNLMKSHPKSLYTKIIIPEVSGLSYIEAWDFMKEILDKYDYYSQ